ncbi:NAD(P)-binding oxidoreductase [Microbacterium sp. CFBP9034]|uniref:NAD(P)-dependent oxidoreductase n=1 Tax=Microbacterium sp. CFBP9034 TaxID=3096540 RepID=UPI002A69887F|nr:NAD(P)-binding oxidoreductase [Microbacterium sp. CFBP9034]MDY0909202.1 NAD(P)-binding oxidoreductase [Microbacterium sp. CFBP9034]
MNILVIGATGGSGRAVCDALLERGHRVTAVARRASRLDPRPGLERVDGDATDRATLDRLLPGHDAVIVTLGIAEPTLRVRLRGAQGTPDDVRSRATGEIIRAARAAGVRRIVVQSSYGVGPTRDQLTFLDRVLFSLMIKPQIFDSELQESLLRGSELEWTIVQPVYLTDGDSDEHFVSTDGRTRGRKVARRGVAQVHAELVEQHAMIGETVSVSG